MKLIETPCFALRAGDVVDLNLNASCFYDVLRLPQELPGMKVEILVQARTTNEIAYEPKYITREYNDTLAKLEATES